MDSSFTKETEKTCVLCCQDIDIFALGKCDHPVCYRCSTKMRVLCEQKYCAVCREELDKVVFVKKLATFSTLPYHKFQCEKKHDIYFSDGTIYTQFRRLLLPECPHCPEPRVFSRFEELEQHVRKQHELFCCKLCTKHLKIFSHERKWYNRKELARHRTQGDPDNTSHRGHPLCKFCDDRYLDNDELLKHLRRDHYFCHFCDADGAQEYYSDYQYLSEHFRESHYLCEEGRCAGEQFTHAFRTEIDYKAHKAAAHSKNRAEARQNRHIDLQFKYAPRPQRRGEGVGMGMVTGEDYEEMRQGGRGGRGRTHGGQKSWRYNREEEDREVAAAMRASMAVRRQEERAPVQDRTARRHEERSSVQDRVARQPEERGPAQDRGARRQEERASVQERGAQKYRNEERLERVERADRQETDELRHRTGPIKPTTEPPVRTMKSKNPLGEDEDFPVLGAPVPTPVPSSKPAPTVASRGPLKEDDFPSLSSASVLSPLTPAYSAQPRKTSSFQDEDFPALVSKIPPRHAAGGASAWSAYAGGGAGGKPSAVPNSRAPSGPPAAASAAPSSLAGPQTLSSSSSVSLSSRRKKKGGENARPAPPRPSSSSSDEEGGSGGPTQREFRPVPTMLDISSLLTVKGGGGGRPQAPTPVIPDATPNPSASKASKKKKTQQQQQQKNTHCPSTPTKAAASMETAAAQKENVPEPSQNKPAPASVATAAATPAGATSGMTNGYAEKALPPPTKKAGAQAATPHPVLEPPPKDEEEFPALTTKKPPPGFKSSFPLKSSTAPAAPCSGVPAPPPGLAGKPPPGFTGIPLNGNVVEPAPPAALDRPPQLSDSYLVPENFQQRNMELIQSIRNYLYNDESKFNQFKNYSGQFRQGLMSAVLYHRSCKELLGENFNRIFNELLVLLPDTGKQQELLAAHGDYKALEKQSGGGGGGGKKNKNKRSAWQTPAANANAVLAELDCQVCPTCRQVLAPEDLNSHKTLHLGESEDFPSLQSISRIIS